MRTRQFKVDYEQSTIRMKIHRGCDNASNFYMRSHTIDHTITSIGLMALSAEEIDTSNATQCEEILAENLLSDIPCPQLFPFTFMAICH